MDPERAPQEEEMPKGIGSVEIALTAILLVLLAGSAVYYFTGKHDAAIGHAALASPDTVEAALEKLFKKPLFDFFGDGAKVCIIAPVQGTDVSFAVRKVDGIISVRRAGAFGCDGGDGGQGEDFIMRFTDPTAFAKNIASLACGNFLDGSGRNGFVYLPSLLWPPGNTPACNALFRDRYCAAIAYCVEPSAVPGNVFACCSMDQLSPVQLRRFQDARRIREQR